MDGYETVILLCHLLLALKGSNGEFCSDLYDATKIECAALNITNGQVCYEEITKHYLGWKLAAIARFQCNHNFRLKGNGSLECICPWFIGCRWDHEEKTECVTAEKQIPQVTTKTTRTYSRTTIEASIPAKEITFSTTRVTSISIYPSRPPMTAPHNASPAVINRLTTPIATTTSSNQNFVDYKHSRYNSETGRSSRITLSVTLPIVASIAVATTTFAVILILRKRRKQTQHTSDRQEKNTKQANCPIPIAENKVSEGQDMKLTTIDATGHIIESMDYSGVHEPNTDHDYNNIVRLSDSSVLHNDYDLKMETAFLDNTYSHVPETRATCNINTTDYTHLHAVHDDVHARMTDRVSDADDTYDVVHLVASSSGKEKEVQLETDRNYDHTVTSRIDLESTDADDYSHLNIYLA